MGKSLGYARVSSRDQNLDSQLDRLHAAGCERIFVDKSSGGTPRERTQLGELLKYLREDDVVVVTKLDRLSRSMMDLLNLAETIRKKGAQLRSLNENLDTTTSSGQLIFNILGTLAEYERTIIRERTKEGLDAARRRGRIGGRPPALDEHQRELVVRLREDGDSLRKIARTMKVSLGTVQRVLRKAQDQE